MEGELEGKGEKGEKVWKWEEGGSGGKTGSMRMVKSRTDEE